jgi:hypothetical protein
MDVTSLPTPLADIILYVTIGVSFLSSLVALLIALSTQLRKLLCTVIVDLSAIKRMFQRKT